jgi:hypothetical protein
MVYFFTYLLDTLRILGGLRTGLALGGSTTTVTDGTYRSEMDDYWNGGTVWLIEDAGGLGAAPELEYRLITDFVLSTNTITCEAFTAAVAAGDRYAVSPPHYPADVLLDCVNLAMKQYTYPEIEYTTLVVVAGQTEYTLPTEVRFGHLKDVYVETVDDANDHRWQKVGEWWTFDDGDARHVIIPEDLLTDYLGNKLRFDYRVVHDDYTEPDQVVHESLESKYVIYRAAEFMLLQQMYSGDEWPYLEDRINYFMAKADLYEAEYHDRVYQHKREI